MHKNFKNLNEEYRVRREKSVKAKADELLQKIKSHLLDMYDME